MTITFSQAIQLKSCNSIHHNTLKNCDGKTCQVFKINGKVKLWKTKPYQFQIPIKRGLREYYYLTENNCDQFHLPDSCCGACPQSDSICTQSSCHQFIS